MLPSLFEEEILHDEIEMNRALEAGAEHFAEALDYFPAVPEFADAGERYLADLAAIKARVRFPSLRASTRRRQEAGPATRGLMQEAGADAIECNLYHVAADPQRTAADIERRDLDVVAAVRGEIDVPLSVKLSPYYSAMAHFATEVVAAGADGLVLFNRFYQPDIDLDARDVVPRVELSDQWELRLPMRWIAILRPVLPDGTSLAATSGVAQGTDVVKALMVGADVAMLTSAVLRHGPAHIATVEADLHAWLDEHEYESVAEVRGSMTHANTADPSAYERANYMRVLHSWTAPDELRAEQHATSTYRSGDLSLKHACVGLRSPVPRVVRLSVRWRTGVVSEGDEFHRFLREHGQHRRITQHFALDGPLRVVDGCSGSTVSRVTAEFGHARCHRRDEPAESIDRDTGRPGFASSGLAMELTAIHDTAGHGAEWNVELGAPVLRDAAERLLQVDVVVGVEMRRVAPRQFAELFDLPRQLAFHGDGVAEVSIGTFTQDPLSVVVTPVSEVDVEPERESPSSGRGASRSRSTRTAHHEARARHDAVVVCTGDSGVHCVVEPEVIRVDDQHPAFAHHAISSRSSLASASQSWACCGGGVHVSDQPSHCTHSWSLQQARASRNVRRSIPSAEACR